MMTPGYKTTEFWLSTLALVVGTLLAAGVFGEGEAAYKVLAFAASALTALGYSTSRGKVKASAELAKLKPAEGIGTSPDPS